MKKRILALVLLTAPGLAHAEDGKALFNARCAACHAPTATKSTPVAPKISGVAGRKIASLGDYTYSMGLKAKGAQSWNDTNLDAYLTAPAKFAPGTRMFVALTKPEERKAVEGYLRTLK